MFMENEASFVDKIDTNKYSFLYKITKMSIKCCHEKIKYFCVECGGSGICEHGKQKYGCKECGGCKHGKNKQRRKECSPKYFCKHGKQKYKCKECSPTLFCEHGKQKSKCKGCGGSSFCEHDKIKSLCKECSPKSFCEHGKKEYNCKECGGSQICEHGKKKNVCVECGGSAICEHDKIKTYCKECGGSAICEHGKLKQYCKECSPKSFCEHDKIKNLCKECGGSGICEHGKQKQSCKECGGSSFCKHGKYKAYCKECGGSALCKSTWCETIGNPKYDYYCVYCYINLFPNKPVSVNYKTKEKNVVDKIIELFPQFTWVTDKKVKDGCWRRRPDLLLDMGSHIIIVEVDEHKHAEYDCSCEHKRLMELSQDVGHRPIIFIRFNPDAYTNQEGELIKSCWKLNHFGVMQIAKKKEKEWNERIQTLTQQIQYWIDNPTEKTIETVELFY